MLHLTCYPITKKLRDILVKFGLIQTPEEAYRSAFMGAPLLTLTEQDSWHLRYSLHAFYASIALLGITPESIEFVVANDAVSIDIISETRNDHVFFRIHQRNLQYEHVHQLMAPCELHTELGIDQELACDCVARHSFSILATELERRECAPSKRFSEGLQLSLLSQMPRHFSVKPEIHNGKATTVVSWDICEPERCLRGFEVMIFDGYPRYKKFLYHSDDSVEVDAMVFSVQGRDKSIRLELHPGTNYTAIARSNRPKAFYSFPFNFTAPINPPWNVNYQIRKDKLQVSWEYYITSTFIVTIYSQDSIIRTEVVEQLVHCFDISDIMPSKVGLRAVNSGLESDEVYCCMNNGRLLIDKQDSLDCSVTLRMSNAEEQEHPDIPHDISERDVSMGGQGNTPLIEADMIHDHRERENRISSDIRSEDENEDDDDSFYEKIESDLLAELNDGDWFDQTVPNRKPRPTFEEV